MMNREFPHFDTATNSFTKSLHALPTHTAPSKCKARMMYAQPNSVKHLTSHKLNHYLQVTFFRNKNSIKNL
jgi:hypothetical protein